MCVPQRGSGATGRRASRGGPRFPGAELTFSRTSARFSGRSSPAEAADRTSPPSRRGATHRVASRSRRHGAAAPTAAAIPGVDSTFSRPCGRFCGRAESGQSPKRDVCIPQRRRGTAGRSASRGGPIFPGADSTFSRRCAGFSGRSSPAEAADRTFPPSCRGATQGVASRSGLGQAAAPTSADIPGAESTFSRTSGRFSGRSSPAEAADRTSPPSCRGATQRVASRSGLWQAAAPTSAAIPGAESTFSRLCARFSGRSSPAEAADRTVPASCRGATQRVASRSRLHKAAAFELAEASCGRLGARSGANGSRSNVSSFATRRSVGGGAGAGGGVALRQADTGGVLVLPNSTEQKQNTLSSVRQDIVAFPAGRLGEARALRGQGLSAGGVRRRAVVRNSAVS